MPCRPYPTVGSSPSVQCLASLSIRCRPRYAYVSAAASERRGDCSLFCGFLPLFCRSSAALLPRCLQSPSAAVLPLFCRCSAAFLPLFCRFLPVFCRCSAAVLPLFYQSPSTTILPLFCRYSAAVLPLFCRWRPTWRFTFAFRPVRARALRRTARTGARRWGRRRRGQKAARAGRAAGEGTRAAAVGAWRGGGMN